MRTLTVRNVADETYQALTAWAHENHRSLQEQARYILESEVKLRQRAVMEEAARYRSALVGRPLGDSVAEIAEDRER
jgi:plasmid stability protein